MSNLWINIDNNTHFRYNGFVVRKKNVDGKDLYKIEFFMSDSNKKQITSVYFDNKSDMDDKINKSLYKLMLSYENKEYYEFRITSCDIITK